MKKQDIKGIHKYSIAGVIYEEEVTFWNVEQVKEFKAWYGKAEGFISLTFTGSTTNLKMA